MGAAEEAITELKMKVFCSFLFLCLSVVAHADAEPLESASPKAPDGLSLEDCWKLAAEQNFDVREAVQRQKQQKEVTREVFSEVLPRLEVHGQFDVTDKERLSSFQGITFGGEKNWTLDSRIDQSVYAGGKNLAGYLQAQLLEQASGEELAGILNQVQLTVAERFYAVLLADAQVEVERQNIALFEEQLKTERDRLSAGTVSRFDVLRAEVDLANSRTPFIRARNSLKISREELAAVLGSESRQLLSRGIRGELKFTPYPVNLEAALAKAEQQRPELRRAKTLIHAESEGVKVQEADYRPKLSVFGRYGVDKSRFSEDLDETDHGWVAGAEVNWNLFDGFKTDAKVEQAQISKSIARIGQARLREDIAVEVRRAYASLQEAVELVTATSKVVEQATESLRLARERYRTGAATFLDTLNSQVALTQARTNYILALHDHSIVVFRLRKATGDLGLE